MEKQYEPPSVAEYGGFEEITKGNGSTGADGNSFHPQGKSV